MADSVDQVAAKAALSAITIGGRVPSSWRGTTKAPFTQKYGAYIANVSPSTGFARWQWGNYDTDHTIDVEFDPTSGVVSHMAIEEPATAPGTKTNAQIAAGNAAQGSQSGAVAILNRLAPGGIVPASWLNGKSLTGEDVGNGYSITTFANTSDPMGTISWGNGSVLDSLTFVWDKATGKVKVVDNPDAGEVKQEALLGIPDAIGSTIDAWPQFLAAITNPVLWKRIGLGAAGVVIVLVVAIYLLKRSESSIVKGVVG